jgi:hypothetical protein
MLQKATVAYLMHDPNNFLEKLSNTTQNLSKSSQSSGIYYRVLKSMSTDVSEVRAASIALMMEVARTSQTSVDVDLRTCKYIPEDCELHTHRRENLKSHNFNQDNGASCPQRC